MNHGVIWHALCTAVVLHVKPCSIVHAIMLRSIMHMNTPNEFTCTGCTMCWFRSARGLHGFATFLRHYINQRVACSSILLQLESTTKYERNRILCLRTALASVKSEPGEFCV